MIIKTNNKDTYLIRPIEAKQFFNVDTDKYIVIDKETNDFVLQEENSFILTTEWFDENVDGRRFRKIKKDIIAELGDCLLKEYAESEKIHEVLSKKFINTSGVSDVLKNAVSNEMNVILFGKGGFGKSEMISELFGKTELKNRVFIKSLSEATTEEDLFGGVNMKKFQDTGVMEYNCENSFANKEIVVFEEIFDANIRVLAALKDALTAKEVRNGNQRFPIKTKIVIGLTNKTYDEVIQDASTEALTQRFPISYKLEYDLTKIDVAGLILNRYNSYPEEKLAAILDSLEYMKDVTPRKVLEMAKYIKDLNIRKNRKYTERITNNELSSVMEYLKIKKHIDFKDTLFRNIVNFKQKVETEIITDYDTMIDVGQISNIVLNSKVMESSKDEPLYKELCSLQELIKNVA